MEREFEDSWKEAFKDSEIIPSDNVWTNIELDLEKEKAITLRRRLILYQWLAAASIIFSIGVSIAVFVDNKKSDSEKLITSTSQTDSSQSGSTAKKQPSISDGSTSDLAVADEQVKRSPQGSKKLITGEDRHNDDETPKVTSPADQDGVNKTKILVNDDPLTFAFDKNNTATGISESENLDQKVPGDEEAIYSPLLRKNAQLVEIGKPGLPSSVVDKQTDPVALMLSRLEQREKEITSSENEKKGKKTGENLWTSVGFSAGSFSAVNSGASPSLSSSAMSNAYASSIVDKETKASGVTYSLGVNLGTKITDRWVFQGGVNLLNQTSEYTQQSLLQNQNFTRFRTASINELDKTALGDASPQNAISTAPYDVNNNVRYLSIPLQAGYLLVNRAFGIQMNAGVATDLFLQNTISATSDGEEVDASKAGIGENTAFRPLNFSGLMGTEVSYRFWKHYRIALNPGVRYPFSSIYKSDDYRASRLTFDVGLRFRYIFH